MSVNYTLPPLDSLPPSMSTRARWARQVILQHPELAEIDEDELLAWVFHDKDMCWYSIAGNFSVSSPRDKMEKRRKQIENAKELERLKNERVQEITIWSEIRLKVLERDNYACQLCGKSGGEKLHIHHILKRNENGTDHFDNLITVCPTCHHKADRSLYNPEWR